MIRRLSSILCLRDLMGRIQAPQTPSYPPPSSYPPPAYQPTSPHSPPAQPRPPQPTADRRLVTEAQQLLSRLGYDIGLVDGTTGDRTTAAVRAFQNDVGQPATGRISTATVAALRARVANLAAASGYDPGTNNSAAADCRHAASPVERMICTQPRLAEADAKLGLAYTAARAAADAQAQRDLTLEQRAWLRQRDACGPNPTCLERSMTARIAELT
jgi:peptidoglycan hydrolase-like protein with peptidoglycan-binding domain